MESSDTGQEHRRLTLLFLGGAKRVAMARMFKAAVAARGFSCRIISYEMDARVPIACEADIVIGRRWSDPGVYADLDRLVRSEKVAVMVPFVDGAVAVACEYVRRYPDAGVSVPAADASLCADMFDKVRSAAIFAKLGLPVPRTYHRGEPCLRLIAKPRYGSASKGIVEISSLETLDAVMSHAADYLIQERIDNREEYSVDCYVELRTGRVLALSPRLRVDVSGGEAVRTVTVADPEIEELTRRVLAATKLRGAVTVQFMRDLDAGGRLLLMEINPRLGGGCVCSVHAGADIPSLIVGEALGEELLPQQAVPGVEIVRYPAEVVFYPDKNVYEPSYNYNS